MQEKENERWNSTDSTNYERPNLGVRVEEVGEDLNTVSRVKQIYVGETARTLRQRSIEHWNKLKNWENNSFILRHWASHHGTSAEPPVIKFKPLKNFREP